MPYNSDNDDRGTCDLCGEPFNLRSTRPSEYEVGEFYVPEQWENPMGLKGHEAHEHLVCHAQCGLDAGLALA